MTTLRRQLDAHVEVTASILDGMSTEEISALVHELWTRQNDISTANDELRRNQSRLEALLRQYADRYDHAPIGCCVFDRAGIIRDVNQAMADMLGIPRRDALNSHFERYVQEDDGDPFRQHLARVLLTNAGQNCDVALRADTGDLMPVRLHSAPLLHGENNADLAVTVVVDISELRAKEAEIRELRTNLEHAIHEHAQRLTHTTQQLHHEAAERRRVGQALQTSEQQYRLLADTVSDGIAILRQLRLHFVNRAFAGVFGAAKTQLSEHDPFDLFAPDERPRLEALLRGMTPGTPPARFQAEAVSAAGREIWIAGEVAPIDWEGEPALLMTARDITEEKRREMSIMEERNRLSKELVTLKTSLKNRYRFGDIIGKSAAMQQVYDQIVRAAAGEANVLLFGESGTGKELVARTIHTMSKRRDRRFVPVNCGAIPEALFESEFFGHRKGAFTGAFRDKEGLFSVAHNGTLFLDELGELPLNMQVKLLRVLDDGEYTRLGDTTLKTADVRIVAATNRNLDQMRTSGQIREDFFFRIHVFAITLPPLRERKEDIPLLLNHFLERYSAERPLPTLPASVMEMLYAYDWPGNVREFQNVAQRYLNGQPLDFIERAQPPDSSRLVELPPEDQASGGEFQHIMDDFEKKLILNVLEQQRWNKSKTAAVLGIPRRTLYRKMARYGIG